MNTWTSLWQHILKRAKQDSFASLSLTLQAQYSNLLRMHTRLFDRLLERVTNDNRRKHPVYAMEDFPWIGHITGTVYVCELAQKSNFSWKHKVEVLIIMNVMYKCIQKEYSICELHIVYSSNKGNGVRLILLITDVYIITDMVYCNRMIFVRYQNIYQTCLCQARTFHQTPKVASSTSCSCHQYLPLKQKHQPDNVPKQRFLTNSDTFVCMNDQVIGKTWGAGTQTLRTSTLALVSTHKCTLHTYWNWRTTSTTHYELTLDV